MPHVISSCMNPQGASGSLSFVSVSQGPLSDVRQHREERHVVCRIMVLYDMCLSLLWCLPSFKKELPTVPINRRRTDPTLRLELGKERLHDVLGCYWR